MSQAPQGPGWWQASDLKWYPPQHQSGYVAPLAPAPGWPMQPPVTTKSACGPVSFVLGGLTLLAIAAAVIASNVRNTVCVTEAVRPA
jgi:hypothetical protein